MAPAPWDTVPQSDTLFVLVTGANSGVGLGICQLLIDEFLSSRSLTSHLILIVTTRSVTKSRETAISLQSHLQALAESSETLRSRAGPSYSPEDVLKRVHVYSIEVDLCDLASIFNSADQLVNGRLKDPCRTGKSDPSDSPRLPRLDSVIFNAGYGGWAGLEWGKLIYHLVTRGIIDVMSYPSFKGGIPGLLIDPLKSTRRQPITEGTTKVLKGPAASIPPALPATEMMGEVFCANVFGHYVLAHQLLPLLTRAHPQPGSIGGGGGFASLAAGRIIWNSSLEALWDSLSLDDFQGLDTTVAYESSKRLTDVLALTSDLPSVRAFSDPFFRSPIVDTDTQSSRFSDEKAQAEQEDGGDNNRTRPRMYVVHPGVMATTLFPLHPLLFVFYRFALYLARWLGSPWHPVTGYNGARAPAYVALTPQGVLDDQHAERVKLGSAASFTGETDVKKTEVEGWGWEGKIEDREALARDPATGYLRKMVGRKPGAVDLTRERLEAFEELGRDCWREMERLRVEWTGKYLQSVGEDGAGVR